MQGSLGNSKRSIEEYDAIGFDMDLTLARYKFRPFIQILFESAATKLVRDHDYPQDMFPDDESLDFFLAFSGRCVVDLKRLLVLKVGKLGEVLRAFSGYDRLTPEQIKDNYGPDGKIAGVDLENLSFGKDYYFASDLFKVDYPLVFLQIKQLLKQKGKYPVLEHKTGQDILDDLSDASSFNYHHYHKKYTPPEEVGFYFPMLKVNPKRFLYKIDLRVFEKLRQLREQGKLVFLVTNAHVGYYDIIFPFITQDVQDPEATLDYVGMNGCKPAFFTKPFQNKFFKVDYSKRDLRAPHDKDFAANKFFLEGNAAELTEDFRRRLGKEDVKVLYFGDNSTGDMHCAQTEGWENAFVFEELAELDPALRERSDYFDFARHWGSWVRDTDVHGNEVDTLLYHKSLHAFNKVFPRVCSDECLAFLTPNAPVPDSN
jgi:HAD superfamily 5'-nucleotidase-like hydrolase